MEKSDEIINIIKNEFTDYIISCKDNCFCSVTRGKCPNCASKEAIMDLYNKINSRLNELDK